MTEKDFLAYNRRFRQRQAEIKKERKQSAFVRICELIPSVLNDIRRRQEPHGPVGNRPTANPRYSGGVGAR